MPIGGGTFTVQNKILPGAYINFVSMGTNAKMGSRGVAALPLELNWGPDDKVFTMTATDFNATSLKVFGYDPILANGTTLTGDKAVAWVAGASAGAEVNESLTNTAYDDAVDVDIKYTKSQFEAAIKAGEFTFYADNGKARVLTDINSLVTIGQNMSSDWTSNRVVRVMDGWANDVARIFGESYIGLVTNSDTGRQLFKADLVALANQYQSIDAISNFKSDDITVNQGDGKRDVAVDCALQPNDSMEKLYMTVVVN